MKIPEAVCIACLQKGGDLVCLNQRAVARGCRPKANED